MLFGKKSFEIGCFFISICLLVFIGTGCSEETTSKQINVQENSQMDTPPKEGDVAKSADSPDSPITSSKSPPPNTQIEAVESEETKGTISKLSSSEIAAQVKQHLSPGETLAHPVFQGPFGPSKRTTFVLFKGGDPVQEFSGFALFEKDGKTQKLMLPALSEDSWAAFEIPAVIFDNLDSDSEREPIIMATYMTGIGPNGAEPFNSNVVLDWSGTEFVHNKKLEKKIESLETAKQIRKALSK